LQRGDPFGVLKRTESLPDPTGLIGSRVGSESEEFHVPIRRSTQFLCVAALIAAAGSAGPVAMAQTDAASTTPATAGASAQPDAKKERAAQVQLLKDWIHYTRIHKMELSKDYATAILSSGLSDTEFVALVEDWAKVEGDFNATVISAQKNAEIEELAARLDQKYKQGKKAAARNASEISRSISFLTKSLKERSFGRELLLSAGEYATPQLLQAFLDKTDPIRQAEVRQVLVSMSKQSIIPLCTALEGLDPASQQAIVTLLGDVPNPYTTALPFLYELREKTQSEDVRRACERAIIQIAGGVNTEMSVSDRFLTLANDYYTESMSLTSFPNEEYQLLWSFDPGIGLVPVPVLTPVFHEAMSMRMSEKALVHNKGNAEALGLWLASNFSREIDSPKDYENPAYPSTRRDATYFAVAAGSTASDRVLAKALDTKDTPLARRAIAAIEKTAGESGLWASESARKPLLDAIAYPNRRVQYEAALALGAAQPRSQFAGSDRIVPLLASAIRSASARYAIIVSDDPEDQAPLATALTARGFTVLPVARQIRDVESEVAEAPGIDLVVTSLPGPATEQTIREVQGRANLSATPVLALLEAPSYFELEKRFMGERGVKISRAGLTPDEATAAAELLLGGSVGEPVTSDEANDYKGRALAVLRDLAVSGNTVLNVADASGPLVSALNDSTGPTRLSVAEVLSYIPSKSVQVALMDAALAATDEEQVSLLGRVADSAKRFGNQLDARHITALVAIATGDGSNEQATAAAALMGALKLPNADLLPLILGSRAK